MLYYIQSIIILYYNTENYKNMATLLPVICCSWRLYQLQGWVILLGYTPCSHIAAPYAATANIRHLC